MSTPTQLGLRSYSLFLIYYLPNNHPYVKHRLALTFNKTKKIMFFIISIHSINHIIITVPYPYHVTGVVDGEKQISLQDRNHSLFLLAL